MTETPFTITCELENITRQLTYLHETWSTAEEQEGAVEDDDFAREWSDAIVGLEAVQNALQWVLRGEGSYLFPVNYAESLCTGHGYPQKVEG